MGAKKSRGADYTKHGERMRRISRERSAAGRDIGDIPPVANSDRKARAMVDFRFYCEQYFPNRFYKPWSDDHLRVLDRIQTTAMRGGLFPMAMIRGFGKTVLCQCATIWAASRGSHPFVMLIGADVSGGKQTLDDIKTELSNNPLLLEDYPEVVYPIHCLENEARRCIGQTHHGSPTMIGWGTDEVVFPTIPGSRASGATIRVTSITGRIRGAVHLTPDGRAIRPSLVLLDDPQSDESAASREQCDKRERTINQAVLGLAGPGKRIAVFMPCTVICNGDLSSRLLDSARNPEWHGERIKMVRSFPTNADAWEQYRDMRDAGLRGGDDGAAGNAFYAANRAALDAGAAVAWEHLYDPHELSAIQHAMNLKFRSEAAFAAECQQEPLSDSREAHAMLSAEEIGAQLSHVGQGDVPAAAQRLTAFIDVQENVLFWLVAAWDAKFGGAIIDYGTEPEQAEHEFRLSKVRYTLKAAAPGAGTAAAIHAGLERLTARLVGREWAREDGTGMRVERCLIDARWGEQTMTVYNFCKRSAFGAIVMPSLGVYIGPQHKAFTEYDRRKGERLGVHWRIAAGEHHVRRVSFDTNFWKSFVHAGLAVKVGDPGSIALFGDSSARHRMIADHLTAEYRTPTEGRGRRVDVWQLRAKGTDNHWLDCLVGAAVAASVQGCRTPTQPELRRAAGGPGGSYAEKYAEWRKRTGT